MRIESPLLRLLIFSIIFSMLHLASCRQLTSWAAFDQQAKTTKPHFPMTQHFSGIFDSLKHGDHSKFKPVSHQTVPGGPNPLHN
ncbi:hypothetical protein Ddye_013677 [Dipteronia dyeriana]|uniref:Uncharacterized protein n=1 Tax=Dipteronia dyeriana TaxID=168575 RepID=A0AAD9X6I6_9ROSI|nr:hypothetical protein Ddye_013677 [Dipteronia dyeriana]